MTYTTTNEATHEITPAVIEMAGYQIKRLQRWLTACDRWYAVCDNLRYCETTYGAGSPECTAAVKRWERTRMPSKVSKYRAYEDGEWLRRNLHLNVERATDRDALRHTLIEAKRTVAA